MKKLFSILLLSSLSLTLFGQVKPSWTGASMREAAFPSGIFFTGFTQGSVRQGETLETAQQRLSREAQALLAENIRVTIESTTSSHTASTRVNQTEQLTVEFTANVQTASEMEIIGMTTETFFDRETNRIYAFAFVNRFELIGFYRANLAMNLTQIESLLQIAKNLEADGEKSNARQQLQTAKSLLENVREAQHLLIAIDQNRSPESLQLQKTENFRNTLTQMQVRLAQAVYVFVESSENLFGTNVNILTNRLKAELAQRGSSFTNDLSRADWHLRITASTRFHNETHGFMVSFADVEVNLINTRRDKSVFQDQFSQRGIATNQEQSGRNALSEAVSVIMERIAQWF